MYKCDCVQVYNFGELLAHKVLDSLKGTEFAWLTDLLFVFNSGDVNKFRGMKGQWSSVPDLAASEAKLFEKVRLLYYCHSPSPPQGALSEYCGTSFFIDDRCQNCLYHYLSCFQCWCAQVCLLCLMEMTFRREATQRHIAFTEIAKETTLPVDQVELLIMKALSQGLVKGRIDEVTFSIMIIARYSKLYHVDQSLPILIRIHFRYMFMHDKSLRCAGGAVRDADVGAAAGAGQAAAGDHDQQDRQLVRERPVHGADHRDQGGRDPHLLTSDHPVTVSLSVK